MNKQILVYLSISILFTSCFVQRIAHVQADEENANSIFVIFGDVTDASGVKATGDLFVVVTNDTQLLRRVAQVGIDAPAGSYVVSFVTLGENSVVAVGDVFKASVQRLRGAILGVASHVVTEEEVRLTKAVIDIQLQEMATPQEPTTPGDANRNPIFVVFGNVTDANGAKATKDLHVIVTNETKSLTQETQIGVDAPAGSYLVSFVALDETSVVAVGDIFKVSVQAPMGSILREASHMVTQEEVRQGKAAINVQITEVTDGMSPTDGEVEPGNQEIVRVKDDRGRITEFVVRADDFTPTADGGIEASQNITINNFLAVDGNIKIDTNREKISGSGTVKILKVPFAGDVQLFRSDAFEIDSSDVDLVKFAGVEMKLTIGRLAVELKKFKILDNGVEIEGALSLPQNVRIVGKESKVEANLLITTDQGIELLGGEIRIEKLALGHTGFRLEDVHLLYLKEENLFEGGCQLGIPNLFVIEGTFGIKEGNLNKVGVGVDEFNKQILATPPIFLQRIFGELDELYHFNMEMSLFCHSEVRRRISCSEILYSSPGSTPAQDDNGLKFNREWYHSVVMFTILMVILRPLGFVS